MKKMKFSKKVKALVGLLAVVGQAAVSSVLPVVVNANILYPDEVTIEYSNNDLYTMTGQYSNGTSYSKKDAPLFAVYEGKKQPVFCYEPEVMIPSEITSGYKSNPLPDMVKNNPRAKNISVFWKYAGTDKDTQIVAQAMFWKEINGLSITEIKRPDGSLVTNQSTIEAKINKSIDDYNKTPSFAGQTVKVNLGESVTVTDTNNSNLKNFDLERLNSANVDYKVDGNKLTITPKKDSNTNGKLRLFKSIDLGTPVAYKKAGNQGVYAGAVDDPNGFELPIEITKTGEAKVTKLDKGTGKPVAGTEFTAIYGGETKTLKTDSDGNGVFKDIPHESVVKITETFVPAPYILDKNNTKEVVVKAGNVATVEFKNERATGTSTLSKVDNTTGTTTALNPNYHMTGAKYGWFKADGTLIKEFTLDDKLTATIDKQELGTYYWGEILPPVGYKIDKTKHIVELKYKDQNTPVVVKNGQSKDDVIRMNFDFQKLIQNPTNELFKNGVEITATNQCTEEKTVVTTATVDGKKGYGQFADMPLDDYLIEETKGVEGYDTIDPILITHSYDKETDTFTFTVKDQKTGNVLNEEKITQTELAKGENVDLGTYTLKDKATKVEKPKVGISTNAHTGDGETNTFVWGEEATFYDDSKLTHENIEIGTKRAYETKLHAVYTDKDGKETTEVVWSSGLIDYEVSDKEMTERTLAEYDYRKDKKVDEKTRWYFSEDGYNYDNEEPTKDIKHNLDGKDPEQAINSVVKEEPKKEEPKKETPTPEIPKTGGSLPVTGEEMMRGAMILGAMIIAGVVSYFYYGNKKKEKVDQDKTTDESETK
ncbi:LPXTG cell wall anchor domain-containing protein [Enterococcus faecalis]|uniref:LPXTG cell wall anchor domain-containing protein n=1 Tax=Enterococcus faecalis TaxID=1351 RepID=UPI001AD76027|nr:LPXTG cell wall anchor domain-containing protein [Enterococcus faecalis]